MKVLIVGSGGREHAIAWKLAQSPKIKKLYAAPGNGGMMELCECVDIAVDDLQGLKTFAKENAIDLTVVGPELPLVLGLSDVFAKENLAVFGPNRSCARFEGSKAFTKEFLKRHGIPTAGYKEYTDPDTLKEDVGLFGYPMVLKADGLAAGKGVLITENKEDSLKAIDRLMLSGEFGEASETIVVEEFLTGREASLLCFVDGHTILPMESAQDYKRALDGDLGLNTGGMGTYSPNLLMKDDKLCQTIEETILTPIVEGFKADGLNYKGILFIGLMIDKGVPKVLEFNVRLGDPETQSVLPRLETDLLDIMEACIEERLKDVALQWSEQKTVSVVMASGGYPDAYQKGKEITGTDQVEEAIVFHAGTKRVGDQLVTDGGRVLCVTAKADNFAQAQRTVYTELKKINFDQAFYRQDIADIAVEEE